MRKARFTLDALDGEVLEGHSSGQSWNGWAVPLFTFEQAQAVAAAWRRHGMRADYDPRADAFSFEVSGDATTGEAGEVEAAPAVEVEGGKYFAVGAGAWIWEEAAPQGAAGKANNGVTA